MTARAISIEAYRAHLESGKAMAQWADILKWVTEQVELETDYPGFTRAELSTIFDMPINVICGRVKELLDAGLIVELPRRRCTVTGHPAHPVTVAE